MKESKMSRSSTPFTACRVVSACSALILICLVVFQNHILTAIDSLRTSLASPKITTDLRPPSPTVQTLSSPKEFVSFVEQDPTGWATRPLAENGGFIETQYNETLNVQVGISMFHALHCVERVRGKIVSNGTDDVHLHHDPQNPLDDDPEARQLHLIHCLDYIVQVRLSKVPLYQSDFCR
jgi:hypothetical protein